MTPWREIRSATHFGPVCPQMMPDTRNETAALSTMSQGRMKAIRDMKPLLSNQTEDCLYLNVYSPLLSSGKHKTSPGPTRTSYEVSKIQQAQLASASLTPPWLEATIVRKTHCKN